jgi:predicted transcriptional regulator
MKIASPKTKRRPKGSGTEPLLAIRLPQQLIDATHKLAKQHQTTKSAIVRQALEEFVKKHTR